MTSKNSNQIAVELRAWIDYPDRIRDQIQKFGAKLDHTKTFTDHYYGEKDSALDCLWEKSGSSVRIREHSPEDCEVVQKEAVLSTGEGFEAGASKMEVLFKGSLEESEQFLRDSGYDKHLLDITKTRETYTIDSMGVCIDKFEKFGPAMEVILRVDKVEEISGAREKLLRFLEDLEVKGHNIESTNVTSKILVSQLSRDPRIKKAALEEELEKYETKLEQSLAKRGDAYTHGGDGWHDNPAFEELEREYHYLVSRIHEIKTELYQLSQNSLTKNETGR